MNIKDGKLCLSQTEMRRVVARGLDAVFIGGADVAFVGMTSNINRPFEITFGEPVPPPKKDIKK